VSLLSSLPAATLPIPTTSGAPTVPIPTASVVPTVPIPTTSGAPTVPIPTASVATTLSSGTSQNFNIFNTASNLKIDKFKGDNTQNVDTWLSMYKQYWSFYDLSRQKERRLIPLSSRGSFQALTRFREYKIDLSSFIENTFQIF
jgi:hypothetical protein